MTNDPPETALMAANAAAGLIAGLVARGLPLHHVLIGLHIEVLAQIAGNFGPGIAAEMCDSAGRNMRDRDGPAPTGTDWPDFPVTHSGGRA